MTSSSISELRKALLASYPDAAQLGAPVIGANRDDTIAAWTWLLGLVRKRSDWWPAIGVALQHAAQDGGDLAREALADFLESYQHSIVLLQWTEPMGTRWPNAHATCRGTAFGEPDYRLETIIKAQRVLWDLCEKETRISVEGINPDKNGPDMGWLTVDVQTQADLESLLARSAEVGKHGDRGEGPWYWLMSSLLFRPALEPLLVAACTRFGAGTDAEVRAMLDWFFEEHDLWRYVSLLESWDANHPSWWNATSDVLPAGWRFPVRAEGARTLGEVALRVLARAREQSTTTIAIDLPKIL